MSRRFFRSRPLRVVLIGVVAFWTVFVFRNLLPFWGPRLAAVEAPKLDSAEPGVRAHIQRAREQAQTLLNDRSAEASVRAAAYGELGKVYLTYNFSDPAAACFRNAGKLAPADYHWPYLLALSLQDAHTAEAATHMATAVERMGQDGTNRAERAAALCFLGDAAAKLDKFDDARKSFAAAVEIQPKHAYALLQLGVLASRAGAGDDALSYLERANGLAPNRDDIRQALGAEYRRRGDTQKAAAFPPAEPSKDRQRLMRYQDPILASVLSLNQSARRLTQTGIQKAHSGRWVEALDLFEKAARSNPEFAPAVANYGRALVAMGRNQDAVAPLTEALRRKPDAADLRLALCLAKAHSESTRQDALDEAARWRKEQPESQAALHAVAEVAVAAGKHRDALATYRDAVKQFPTATWAHLGLASTLAATGSAADARSALERSLNAVPDPSTLRLHLARLLAASPDSRARDPRRGLAIVQELIASGNSAARQETLAVALAATGDFAAAIGAQRQAVKAMRGAVQPAVQARAAAILRSLVDRKPWREPRPFGAQEPDVAE